MSRAARTHFLEPFPERLPAAVKPHCHIVERNTQTGRNPIPRLAQKIGAPDDLAIFRLERGQQSVQAIANHPVEFVIEFRPAAVEVTFFQGGLSPSSADSLALVVDYRICQDPAKPSSNRAHIAQL